jgi:hypothetical protein
MMKRLHGVRLSVRNGLAVAVLGLCAFGVLGSSGAPAQAPGVPKPSEFLNLNVGADGVIANYRQIVSYWKAVDAASDRITVQDLGSTTMGNPYIVAVVTSPENQAKLQYYRDLNNRLYDPRKTTDKEAEELIANGKTIITMQFGIHSDELGGPQLSMEAAYRFATDNSPRMRDVLDHTIIVVTPAQNPDGVQLVADWNAKTAGTRYEGGALPFLYNKYVGHDNNRDWYMFTQKESQIAVGIWNRWHPQISFDIHQMGVDGARIFIPPYVDPCDPNVDPILRSEIASLGSVMAAELISQGKQGVVTNAMYDMWTPARAYVNYHGGVRILTEAASARLASPVLVRFDQLTSGIGYDAQRVSWNFPVVWRGGFWRLRDIMDYEQAAVDALLDHATKYRTLWLTSFYRVNKNAIGRVLTETGELKPYAVVIPADQRDQMSASKMLSALQFADVEISRARSAFTAEGRTYPAGSHVILMAQPASPFVKTLTEVQHYPDLREYPGGPPQRPYDATAFTMPLLMGVNVVRVQRPFTADLELVPSPIQAAPGAVVGGRASYAYVLPHDSAGLLALSRLAKAEIPFRWALSPFKAVGRQFEAGSILVPVVNQPAVHQAVAALAKALPTAIYAINDPVPQGAAVRMPRIGLYKSYIPAIDEGWTRWLLEQFEIPYTSLENRDVRAGGLRTKYDVIVLPDQAERAMLDGFSPGSVPPEYVGGLGQPGVEALRGFIEDGGTVVAMASASLFAIDSFRLPVENVLAPSARRAGQDAEFYAPGSIVRTRVDTAHPVAFGSPPDGIAWLEQSPAFRPSGPARAIVSFPEAGSLLLSGWLLGGQRLSGAAGVVEAPLGRGRVILFGFLPQFRAQTWATFGLFFNSLYYSTFAGAAR